MSIRNPHDAFFRQVFGQPEVAADFLANYLPANVRAHLDLSQVELQQDSFLDPSLHEHFADLLFRVPLLEASVELQHAFVYVLFEHKSQPDPLVAFQLLRYLVHFWERNLREVGALPPVIPLVVYHGEQPWRVPRTFGELFEGPDALRPYWPNFAYDLQDLSTHSDEDLRGEVVLRVALLALKTIFARNAAARLPGIVSLLLRGLTDEQHALEYLRTVLLYLGESNHLQPQDMLSALTTADNKERENIMSTLREKWAEMVREEVREEGREEGMLRIVLNQLEHRFGTLDEELVQRTRNCSSEQLIVVSNLLLDASALAEVRQYLNTAN